MLSLSGKVVRGRRTHRAIRRRAQRSQLLQLLPLLLILGCGGAAPETPQNAVMDYLTALDVGHADDAASRLCERLRDESARAEMASYEPLLHRAAVFGTGVVTHGENETTVQLEVVFAPAAPGERGELWRAVMVKENDNWKVCGFEAESDR